MTFEGDDPTGYALAVNINRRHMKPGARYVVIEEARRLAVIPNPVFRLGVF